LNKPSIVSFIKIVLSSQNHNFKIDQRSVGILCPLHCENVENKQIFVQSIFVRLLITRDHDFGQCSYNGAVTVQL